MTKFEAGESVSVPCEVQAGAFPGENLVTISTANGQVSGFVREADLIPSASAVYGVVRDSNPDTLSVQLSGSYFTTNGLVELAADWARQNVRVIA